jgi:SSS family solute:Na+ symporter
MYPHSITSVLSCSSRDVIKRNCALLPAYSFLLALMALLGYMTIAAGLAPASPNNAVPDLFAKMFPPWFAGFAFAAIAIGALVPAAIMSIAAANLFTRNVYRQYINQRCSAAQEAGVAKVASLVVKAGALAVVLALPTKYAIDLQLLAGGWILQIFPAVAGGLYTRWLHARALLAGWAAGMLTSTAMTAAQGFNSVFPLHVGQLTVRGYAALYGLIANVIVCVALTLIFDALRMERGPDATAPEDYEAEAARAPADVLPSQAPAI